MKNMHVIFKVCLIVSLCFVSQACAGSLQDSIYKGGELTPIDSSLRVVVGDPAPDFELPAVSGERVRLSQYSGKKNVVLAFVPAAWTPVCSEQFPGYNIAEDYFVKNDAVIIGITVDNIPTQFAWIKAMGSLWFPVVSDFWPHGKVADMYGVLRSDGTAERALFVIDKKGIIRAIHVGDINLNPDLEVLINELVKMNEE
jgi:peroxiredoxin (alkyl hydroperoxide reductase subunit C)